MSETLQPLLERIRSEGLHQAESEKEHILASARAEAETILDKAKDEAEALQEQAETEANASLARGKAALEQAARDVLLTLRTEINKQVQAAAAAAAANSLNSSELVSDLLKMLVAGRDTQVTAESSPELGEKLKALLPALLQDAGAAGGEVILNPKSSAGFKLRFEGSSEGIDMTDSDVAEWISAYLRPELAALLRSDS